MTAPRQIIFLFLLSSLILACTPAPKDTTLHISGPFEPVNLDPASAGYMFTRMQIIETLVDVDNDGNLIPGLATSWKSNADLTRWTFHLRPGVTFHDGTMMDAESVRKSLAVALGKPAPFPVDIVTNIEIVDPLTVSFTLKAPYRPFPSLLSNYTTAILSPASFGKFNRMKALIGTGPYEITDFIPPHNIKAKRFEKYRNGPATIESVDYVTGHRSETRALMVRTGQADIVFNLDPPATEMLKQDPDVNVHTRFIPRTTLVKLNSGNEKLSDVRVRQALSLAIDRQAIAEGILHVKGAEANQLFGPSMGTWHDASLPPLATNIEKANALLDEAGWELRDDGIRYRDGKPLSLSMITYANRPELITIATAIQAQWREAGVELAVHMENASAIPSGHSDGTLETALLARNFANIPDPLGILLADFTSVEGGEWGPMNWSNERVFSIVNQLASGKPDDNYYVLQKELISTLNEDMPLIPVAFYVQQSATSSRVRNFSFDPYERSFRIDQMRFQSK